MDDSNERTSSPIGATSIFGRISSGHCDLDNMAFSPSSSEFNPCMYVPIRRRSSLITHQQNETSAKEFFNNHYERRNSRRDSHAYSPKRRNSNLSTSNFQSFDSLTQIMRENQYGIIGEFDDINQVTQSLPATPLTTPQASPLGSPKSDRKKISMDYNCSLPWYYTGFISANATPENSSLVCKSEKQMEKHDNQQIEKRGIEISSENAVKNNFPVAVANFYQKKKYSFTNRDMNFLAPTTM